MTNKTALFGIFLLSVFSLSGCNGEFLRGMGAKSTLGLSGAITGGLLGTSADSKEEKPDPFAFEAVLGDAAFNPYPSGRSKPISGVNLKFQLSTVDLADSLEVDTQCPIWVFNWASIDPSSTDLRESSLQNREEFLSIAASLNRRLTAFSYVKFSIEPFDYSMQSTENTSEEKVVEICKQIQDYLLDKVESATVSILNETDTFSFEQNPNLKTIILEKSEEEVLGFYSSVPTYSGQIKPYLLVSEIQDINTTSKVRFDLKIDYKPTVVQEISDLVSAYSKSSDTQNITIEKDVRYESDPKELERCIDLEVKLDDTSRPFLSAYSDGVQPEQNPMIYFDRSFLQLYNGKASGGFSQNAKRHGFFKSRCSRFIAL